MSSATSLIGRLFEHARNRPEHCAIAATHQQLSHAELARLVCAQAERLAAAGIGAGTIVGIESANDIEHLVLCLAAAMRGTTACTISTFESAAQREKVVKSVGVTHVIGADQAIALSPEGAASDTPLPDPGSLPAAQFLFSTSGTTGEPKIVIHSDANLVAQAHRHVGAEERFACLAAIEHNFAKRHRLYCVAEGATNVFIEPDPETVVAQCQALEATTMHLSAFQAQEFLAYPNVEALRGIRLKLGGSHVPEELRARLRERLTRDLHCGYGTTETGAIGFTDPDDPDTAGSVGRALPGIEIRVVDADRRPLPTGERGEVAIGGPGMFTGYLNRPETTTARLADGWFYTGDTGTLDAGGRLRLSGRSDDMFVFNSINIHPQEIEAQICQHPDVLDAAVLPKHSEVHGDVPVALVVFAANAEPDVRGLKKFVRDLVGLRTPRQFTVADEIPRNAAGKILRAEAQALLGIEPTG